MSDVAVIGGGSFGTVIANIIAGNGHEVRFWMRSESLAKQVNKQHENPEYLPGYPLAERVVATHDMAQPLAEAASSSLLFRVLRSDLLYNESWSMPPGVILVSTTKGIEAGSFMLMSEVLKAEALKQRSAC